MSEEVTIEPESPPLLAGRIQGVRAWDILRGGPAVPPLLSSPSRGGYWPARADVEAECRTCREPHEVPAADCACGIYAWHPWSIAEDAPNFFDDDLGADDEVVGLVEAWGRTELSADGFRSRFARPTTLFVSTSADEGRRREVTRIAAHYGVEVVVVDGLDGLADACADLPNALDPATVERLVLAETQLELFPDACGFVLGGDKHVGGSGFVLDCLEDGPKPFSSLWPTTLPGVLVVRLAGASFRPDALQDGAFAPGRALRLVPEPTNLADPEAIAVWDAELSLHAGYVPAILADDIGFRLRSGQVRAVRSLWQWRDLRSGERTGLHMLISVTDRLALRESRRKPPVEAVHICGDEEIPF